MKSKRVTSRWSLYLMLLGSMALWGGTWPVGRAVAVSVAPWNAAFLRFLMATIVLVLICGISEGWSALRVKAELLPRLFMLGASGIFAYSFLFFSALRTIPSGRAALIVGCIPTCVAIGSSLIARRQPRLLSVVGIVLSFVGVSVVVGNGNPFALLHGGIEAGDLMILGCVACWTAYTLLARPVMREVSPLIAVTWSCITGCVMLLPFSVCGGLFQDISTASVGDWLGLAYLGVAATSFGYYWYYKAIERVGAVASGIFINLVPLFAVMLGCIFLKERLHPSQMVGGLMVILGVLVTVRANR